MMNWNSEVPIIQVECAEGRCEECGGSEGTCACECHEIQEEETDDGGDN